MAHPNLLDAKSSALLVIDVQEGFRTAISEFDALAAKVATVVRGFQILGVPVFVTEQYPNGLGHTASEIDAALSDDAEVFEKTAFSSCGSELFLGKLTTSAVTQVVICGLETHVCVNQTAHDLLDRNIQVHLLTDCVGSRSEENKAAGLSKMLLSGVVPSSVEMALFEVMRDAKNPKFKEIQALIK